MSEDRPPATGRGQAPPGSLAGGVATAVARVALGLAVVTALSRVVGFGRTWVLSQTLGTSCLGTSFTTANTIPNVVFEVVVGGALAGMVVPLLAGSLARGDRAYARTVLAGLYGWALVLLLPAMVLVAVLAGPLSALLLGQGSADEACSSSALLDVAASLLVVFAVQIPLYGLTVVAQGALQSDHRFQAPAWAPLISSLAMITVLLAYASLAGDSAGSVTQLSSGQLALLAWGTTGAVALLWLTQVPATLRAGLWVRPSLRFPDGVATKARSLGVAGLAVVAGQWLVYGLLFRLVNDRGVEGSAVVLLLAWTVFLLPWAVLVFPVATGTFPRLASWHEQGDRSSFAGGTAGLLRATLLLGALGAAGLAATAPALSTFLVLGAPGRPSVSELGASITAFAPAVVGFALLGGCGRVLYAAHRGPLTSTVTVAGWLAVAVVAVVGTRIVAAADVVAAVGVAVSVGLVAGGLALVVVVVRVVGPAAFAGGTRATLAAVVAATVSVVAGRAVTVLVDYSSVGGALVVTLAAGAVTLACFVAVAGLLDRRDLRDALRGSRRSSRSR